MRTRTAALVVLCALAAACGGAEKTGREALEALRAALSAGDGAAFYGMLDSEGASRVRAEVRERRAMLARGDDPAAVLEGMPITAEELGRGEEKDAVALFYPRGSPFFQDAKWFAAAAVAEERPDGPDAVRFTLRGGDAFDRPLWFVRESGAWRFDLFRTRREWR